MLQERQGRREVGEVGLDLELLESYIVILSEV